MIEIAAFVLTAGVCLIITVFPKVNTTLEITNALEPFLDAENQYMFLELDTEIQGNEFQMQADVYAVKEDSVDYLVIEEENILFYMVDNLFLLENGKAFLLTESQQHTDEQTEKYRNILPLIAAAFDEFEISQLLQILLVM